MLKLYAVVFHHPARDKAFLYHTLDRLQAVRGPHIHVKTDHDSIGIWPMMRKAILEIPDGYTHIFTAPDDLDACKNFMPAVMRAVETHPDSYLNFYRTGVPHPDQSLVWERNPTGGGTTFGQVMPVGVAKAVVEWADSFNGEFPFEFYDRNTPGKTFVHDDAVFANGLFQLRIDARVARRSYLQHRGWNASLLNHNMMCMQSVSYVGSDFDALSVNWESD